MQEIKEKETLLLCFTAEVWKQIWLKCRIYSYYKRIDIDINLLWKSFKFNLFSPVGAFFTLRPYLIKGLQQGFLMPGECSKEAERSVLLFSRIYEINKFSSICYEKSENTKLKEFFLEQCLSAFEISYFSFIFLDLKNIEGNDKHEKLSNLCNLMDAWDVNLDLADSFLFPSFTFTSTSSNCYINSSSTSSSSSSTSPSSNSSSILHLFICYMFLPFIS